MFWHPEASAKAAQKANFRLMTGPIFFDPDHAPDNIPAKERGARGREFIESFVHDSFIIPASCPTAPIPSALSIC
ncbi:MAG: hypothetical protein R2880_16850 [Deinococcales bacterium]